VGVREKKKATIGDAIIAFFLGGVVKKKNATIVAIAFFRGLL
jgi:hypothetical protein